MPERDGKDEGEDSPKRLVLVRSPLLISHKWRELVPSGVWFPDVMTSFSGVTFVLFCFVFVFMLSLKPRPFVQSSFGMQAPRKPHVFIFIFLEMSFFPSIFWYYFRFLFVWTIEYVVRSFLPNGVFLPCDHGLDF